MLCRKISSWPGLNFSWRRKVVRCRDTFLGTQRTFGGKRWQGGFIPAEINISSIYQEATPKRKLINLPTIHFQVRKCWLQVLVSPVESLTVSATASRLAKPPRGSKTSQTLAVRNPPPETNIRDQRTLCFGRKTSWF